LNNIQIYTGWDILTTHVKTSRKNKKQKVILDAPNISILLQRMITILIECTRRHFTAATRHKQHYCDMEIDEKGTLNTIEHDKYGTIASPV
jgi:hypothetical protein